MTVAERELIRDAIGLCDAFLAIGDGALRQADSETLQEAVDAIRRVQKRLEDLGSQIARVH